MSLNRNKYNYKVKKVVGVLKMKYEKMVSVTINTGFEVDANTLRPEMGYFMRCVEIIM